MSAIKFQIFRVNAGPAGIESCDFSGENKVLLKGDQHRTIPKLEIDPAPEGVLEVIRKKAPDANAAFKAIYDEQPAAFADLADMLGLEGDGPVGLRIGILDN